MRVWLLVLVVALAAGCHDSYESGQPTDDPCGARVLSVRVRIRVIARFVRWDGSPSSNTTASVDIFKRNCNYETFRNGGPFAGSTDDDGVYVSPFVEFDLDNNRDSVTAKASALLWQEGETEQVQYYADLAQSDGDWLDVELMVHLNP